MKVSSVNIGAGIVGGVFGFPKRSAGITSVSDTNAETNSMTNWPYARQTRRAILWLGDRWLLAKPQGRPGVLGKAAKIYYWKGKDISTLYDLDY